MTKQLLSIPSTIESITSFPADTYNLAETVDVDVVNTQQSGVPYVEVNSFLSGGEQLRLSRDTISHILDVLDDVSKLAEKV